MDEFLYTLILLFSRKRKDTNNLTFSHDTQKPHKHDQNLSQTPTNLKTYTHKLINNPKVSLHAITLPHQNSQTLK